MTSRAVPPGTTLLHIGPHKTGTTAIQGAFDNAREAIAEQGVVYAGRDRQPRAAAIAVSGSTPMRGEAGGNEELWDRLVDEVHSAGRARVVVSSEFFCDCEGDAITRVVDALGPNLHVVITLRPLWKIVPSQWQQYVQNGLRQGYDAWLDAMFRKAPFREPTPSFWRRHDHAALVRRWTAAVGPERLTVVVVDDTDREGVLRVMESLTGLREGTLALEQDTPVNRSLSFAETELVRRLNRDFRAAEWPDVLYARYLRYGALTRVRAEVGPPAVQDRITTPRWALDLAAERGRETVAAVQELGVGVIGDLSIVGGAPDDDRVVRAEGAKAPVSLDLDTAAQALLGAIEATGRTAEGLDFDDIRHREVGEVTSTRLVQYVVGRVLGRLTLRRLRRRAMRAVRRPEATEPTRAVNPRVR